MSEYAVYVERPGTGWLREMWLIDDDGEHRLVGSVVVDNPDRDKYERAKVNLEYALEAIHAAEHLLDYLNDEIDPGYHGRWLAKFDVLVERARAGYEALVHQPDKA